MCLITAIVFEFVNLKREEMTQRHGHSFLWRRMERMMKHMRHTQYAGGLRMDSPDAAIAKVSRPVREEAS